MSQLRRQRRELKRLIDKIQTKEKTKYKFEEVFRDIMNKESTKVINTPEEIEKLNKLKEYGISDTSK